MKRINATVFEGHDRMIGPYVRPKNLATELGSLWKEEGFLSTMDDWYEGGGESQIKAMKYSFF